MSVIADRYDAFLFDLDGVLYRGRSVPGAAGVVSRLRSLGKRVAFVTNNSGRTPETVAEHLRAVGVAAEAGEVETSALTTASLLARRGIASAYVVGEGGIRRALAEAGWRWSTGNPIASTWWWSAGTDVRTTRRCAPHPSSCKVARWLVATNPDAS